ncbi:2TM domain-containing protein [Hyunsoonleella sp. SJ7]|uniref:2TM domain-containing protein n=1 Tax=Hyunsoonleella aquatilis TaxID=2762758 RepID=A0A923HDC5_9FLAO|nr:2TM domain-containing protein [Hyunsoonleella aquatilis]MBC3759419.1 2TM domain-containing protein [Hyunsoonleella aquatilis]
MKKLSIEKQNDRFTRARLRVKELKGLYCNIFAYCLVIPFLAFINYKTFWEIKWFLFSAIGWGIGIAFHAYRVYARNPIFGHKWEQRKIEQFMREERENRWN